LTPYQRALPRTWAAALWIAVSQNDPVGIDRGRWSSSVEVALMADDGMRIRKREKIAVLLPQTTSTEVQGAVSDTTGTVVPGAAVTLLRVQPGEQRTAVTEGNGNYPFPLIEIGHRNPSRGRGAVSAHLR
jgi:carboxypeptidase family protein